MKDSIKQACDKIKTQPIVDVIVDLEKIVVDEEALQMSLRHSIELLRIDLEQSIETSIRASEVLSDVRLVSSIVG